MTLYTFHRKDVWYGLELPSDQEACRNALCNPGTTKVINEVTGQTVWQESKCNCPLGMWYECCPKHGNKIPRNKE